MNTKKIALAITLLSTIAFASGLAVASLLLSHQITTTLIVKPTVSMMVCDIDGHTPLDSIPLGQFNKGMEKWFPIGQDTPPSDTFYYVNNTDQMDFYVSFTWADLPPYSDNYSWYVYICRGDQSTFTKLNMGEIYSLPIKTHLNDPDPETQYAVWYFKFIIDPNCPFGTYTPTLTVNAFDTALG